MDLSDLTTRLQEKFPDTVLEVAEESDEVTLQLKGSSILEILYFQGRWVQLSGGLDGS